MKLNLASQRQTQFSRPLPKIVLGVSAPRRKKIVAVDAIVKKNPLHNSRRQADVFSVVTKGGRKKFRRVFEIFQFLFGQKRFSYAIVVVFLLIAFASGMATVYQTSTLKAEDRAGAASAPVRPPIPLAPVASEPIAKIPNDVLFNMSLAQLENYLSQALNTPQAQKAELLVQRKVKLLAYLEDKHSPFVSIVDTLVKLKHWKLVLAISNSESTLGKRCYTNNCSGIGVQPGHPLWRTYPSTTEWAIDLDNLLDKRYNNWTLEQMNGVYNQPGSKNWLLAAKQVLEELQSRGIE